VRMVNANGWTALHSTAAEGHDSILRLLLDKDADVTATG
jgi:ankyrin repeat protein